MENRKVFDAIGYFSQWISKGLLSDQEIENFSRNLPKFWESVEAECEENPAVMFNLYEAV